MPEAKTLFVNASFTSQLDGVDPVEGAALLTHLLDQFKVPEYQEISLSDWLTHTPAALVAQHLNIDPAVLARFPSNQPGLVPG